MRWKGQRRSTNVEDRRGRRFSPGAKIGGGATLLIVLLGLLFGVDPGVLTDVTTGVQDTAPPAQPGAAQDEAAAFVSVVLASTEDVWATLFRERGGAYRAPTLVLFDDMVQSACGLNSAATGPFYCPGDQKVYLDLGFFRQLARLGGSGDFAAAYVIGHEVGHHVQRLVGTERQVRQLQQQMRREADRNALSVLMELQADCYAGVWAHHADRQRDLLERGDIEEGLNAAAAIGDDRLLAQAGRAVQPESFTHGSSEQRVEWFRTGIRTGSFEACDTFSKAGW